MYYDEESSQYFEDLEDIEEHYFPDAPPEFIYGTKPTEVSTAMATILTDAIIDILDDQPEYGTEEDYFSERLTAEEREQLQEDIRVAVQKVTSTVVCDYANKIIFNSEECKSMYYKDSK